MKDIYWHARRVLIWLGESKEAVQHLTEIKYQQNVLDIYIDSAFKHEYRAELYTNILGIFDQL